MGSIRLSRAAKADLVQILITSEDRWGTAARRRYQTVIAAAMRRVADDPEGLATRVREDLAAGIRSFHLRHARIANHGSRVRQPAHVLYYRRVAPDLIEIVRVLHERMEPRRHLPTSG
jgi:toxin ParE1/3/4